MEKTIAERVKDLIAKQLEKPLTDIKDGASFVDDLGADSLTIAEMVMSFEDDFKITLADEEAEKIKTVQDAILAIEAKLKA